MSDEATDTPNDAPSSAPASPPADGASGAPSRAPADTPGEAPADTREWHDDTVDQFRRTGGTVEYYGRVLVLLHHRGAQSGTERVTPIVGIRDGDDWLIAASRRGHEQNPAWFHDVLAHPDVEIETPDDGTVAVRATRLLGADRDEAWARFTSLSPVFDQYQAKTSRLIPLLRLARRG